MSLQMKWIVSCVVAALAIAGTVGFGTDASSSPVRSGTVTFEPAEAEATLPAHFQLKRQTFQFEQKPLPTTAAAFEMSTVTFPSPVKTPHENNNTVHCEYFRPKGDGKRPAVIVLHILGGDFDLARLFCRSLAHSGTAALFLKMPYYGPRRQPGVSIRMVSLNPKETVQGMTQAILDIRRGAAWLSAQDEVDPAQLGIMGISLGGITSALATTAEPRFSKACLLLAGGDIGQVAWESKEVKGLREKWIAAGGSKESLIATLKSVDPVTYGSNVRRWKTKVLMLNASHDEVIPRACTDSLWKAFGEPPIVWWDAGHYSAVRFIFDGMAKTTRFFSSDGQK